MAYSVSVVRKTVYGDSRVNILSCTADAATQTIDTGLSYVESFSLAGQSLTTGAPKVFANKGAVGTSIAGSLGCSGFTSGDVFFIMVYGR